MDDPHAGAVVGIHPDACAAARGGDVEVSSHGKLTFSGDVQAHQLLLDPKNIVVSAAAARSTGGVNATDLTALIRAGTSLVLQANNDLTT